MKIPILLYHSLFDAELSKERYSLSKEEFELQIKYLSENSFRGLLLEDLYRPYNSFGKERKHIIITFDDGNYSDYSIAFPILKKYGFPATFFITVNWIAFKNYLNWSQFEEMISNGMSIQSHSLNHLFLSDLNMDNLYKELSESKRILEQNLNIPIKFFSLPGGFCSKRVLDMANKIGYKGVCNSLPGLNVLDSQEGKFIVVNRFVITRKTSFQDFRAIVDGNRRYLTKCKAQYYLKAMIKKVLGSQRYYALWHKYFREV